MRNTCICRPFCTAILVNHRQRCGEVSIHIIKRFPASYRIQQLYYHIHRTISLSIILIKLNPARSHTSHSFKSHFNIILPCIPGSSNWSLPYRLYDEKFLRIFYSPHACYIFCQSHTQYLSTLTVSVEMCCLS
jgi:hypothetical protein